MKRINILHLTDFHFGLSPDSPPREPLDEGISQSFLNEIRDIDVRNRFLVFVRRQNMSTPINVIAFTGDLGFGGQKDTLVSGIEYLERLAKDISVSPGHVLICPGNHDLDRRATDDTELDEFCTQCQKRGFSFANRTIPAVVDNFGPSIIAMNSCLGGTQHALHGGLNKEFWKEAKENLRDLEKKYETDKLIEKVKQELQYQLQCMDIPALGYNQIDTVADKLTNSNSNCVIVLMHHNTLPSNTADIRPYANLIDSGQLITRLIEKGRRVILLHGHVHCDSELSVFSIREDMAGGFIASIDGRGLLDRNNAAANLVELCLTDTNDFIKANVSFIERIGDDFQCRNQYVLLNRHREMGDIELKVRNTLELNKSYAFVKVAELLGTPANEELAEKLIQLDPKPLEITVQKSSLSEWRINRVQ